MSLSTYQLAERFYPSIATGALISGWLFQGLFIATAWHMYRALKKVVSPKTKAAQWMALIALTLSVGVMEGQPFTYLLGLKPSWETMKVVKDSFLVLYALSVILATEYLHPRANGIPRAAWLIGAAFGVGGAWFMYWTHLMRLPTFSVMIYCAAAFAYGSYIYKWLADVSSSSIHFLRLRTIGLGYGLLVLFSLFRAWQTPALPDHTRIGFAIMNRLILLASTLALYLGLTMPQWYERAGVAIADVFNTRQYLGRLRRFYTLVNDLTRNVSDPQRNGLACLACEASESLGSDCSVVWDVALTVPLKFKRYKGVAPSCNAPAKPFSKGLERDLRHFVFVHDALMALMAPKLLADAPMEAKIVRGASRFLDKEPLDAIAAETSPEVLDAIQKAAERRVGPHATI